MILLGYVAAVLIGVSLGLIGGGGSILTLPVLVYLFGIGAAQATSYSLFIVGSTSLVGAYTNYRKGQVDLRKALMFGLSSIITVFLIRKLVVPVIPETIAHIRGFSVSSSLLTMVLFAVLMVAASVSMIRSGAAGMEAAARPQASAVTGKLLLYGVGVGLVTGLLGAGGGFLLIPALVMLLRMPMKEAVGTSLLIIALNSLIGFAGDIGHIVIDWGLLLTLTGIAIGGILIGFRLSRVISGSHLKKGFGWFVLIMGVYILIREIILK